MRTKTLSCAVILALFPVVGWASTNPFVPNGSVTVNSMPQSENPIWTPPLASPSVTSSGILSAFYTSNMSQANPNSPQPSVAPCPAGYSGSNGTYQWSGSDNTGWVLTGDTGCVAPPPPPVVAAYVAPATTYVAPPPPPVVAAYVAPATTYVAPATTTTTAVPAVTTPSGPAFGGFAGTSPNGIGYGVGGNTTVTPSTPTLYPAATTPIYYNVISGGSGGGVGAGSGGSVQWNQSQNIQQKTVPSNFSWTNLWSSFSNFW